MSTATYIGAPVDYDEGGTVMNSNADRPFYDGIPARNLSAADYAALSPDLQAIVQSSPLYTFIP